eukprot:8449960-Alexandrium_andersonii.AAC.1
MPAVPHCSSRRSPPRRLRRRTPPERSGRGRRQPAPAAPAERTWRCSPRPRGSRGIHAAGRARDSPSSGARGRAGTPRARPAGGSACGPPSGRSSPGG